MSTDRDIESALQAWLVNDAQAMPEHVLRAVGEAVPRAAQVGSVWPLVLRRRERWLARVVLAVAAVLAVVLVGPNALDLAGRLAPAGPGASTVSSVDAFAGRWTSVDCATWWAEGPDGHVVDCSRSGDGTVMRLEIEPGDAPRLTVDHSYVSSCDGAAGSIERWEATGSGLYEERPRGLTLVATLTMTACGPSPDIRAEDWSFYRDPGSDTLWEDRDGDFWGHVWRRAP